MQTPFLSAPGAYSFFYFCKFSGSDKEAGELASFISSLNTGDNAFGFDRSLWSELSSGQMPSQLYAFNFYGSDKGCDLEENILTIFTKNEIVSFPDYLDLSYSLKIDKELFEGQMADSFEEDDEFQNCLYATCLVWGDLEEPLPAVENVKNLFLKAGDKSVQLLIGKSIYSQDDWVESFFNDESCNNKVESAAHLIIPCSEKIKTLEEAVQDKERIHLDPEIKGIYC